MVTHPAIQAVAATFSLSAFSQYGSPIIYLAVPGAIYYTVLCAQLLMSAPTGWLGTCLAKIQAMWQADKPYLAALCITAGGIMTAIGYQPPTWFIWLGAAAGVATIHSVSKGPKS